MGSLKKIIELAQMLDEDYLPVNDSKLGGQAEKLFKYLKTIDSPDEYEAAREIGVKPSSNAFRKVKHHLKLALINGVTAIKPQSSTSNIDNRMNANDFVWNYVCALRSESESVKNFIVSNIDASILNPARTYDLQEPLTVGYVSQVNSNHIYLMKRKYFVGLIDYLLIELEYDYKLQISHKLFAHNSFLNIKRTSNEEKAHFLNDGLRLMNSISSVERPRTINSYLYLELKLSLVKGEYRTAITQAKQALDRFDHENPLQAHIISVFKNNILRAYLNTSLYQEGLSFAKQVLSETKLSSKSYYGMLELTTVMALRSEEYQLAYSYYDYIIESGRAISLSNNFKETFLIIEAYLQLLIEMNLIDVSSENKKMARIRIGKFMNDMVFSHKEKALRNVHVIIIRVLNHSLNRRGQDFDQGEAVRKYVQRHLNEPSSIRAKNFLLALIQFPENGFHKKIAIAKAERYINQLHKVEMGQNHQHPYGEIIPFEKLWNHVITL